MSCASLLSVQFSHSLMSDSAIPWTAARQASLSITNSWSYSNSCPLSQWCHPTISSSVVPRLLLPSIFPSIRVFSNESVLGIRWPKYWKFRFSISPSSEYSGLISFRMDWLDLLAVQGILKKFSLSSAPVIHWDAGICQCLFSLLWLSQFRGILRSASET